MRTKRSTKNLIYAWGGQFALLFIKFAARRIFVHILNSEYLGIDGLFSNILSMLSLAELGIGTAIIYSLYKPLAANDAHNVNAIMHLYKKIYRIIGIFISAAGIALTPFLYFFMKDIPDIPHIRLIYVLFVLNSSVSYFFSYKSSLIIADQRSFIYSKNHYFFSIFLNIVQIVVLYITKNYILFVLCQFFFTVLENYFIARKADQLYPFLRDKAVPDKVAPETVLEIKRNTFAMLLHKIGGVVILSTDNLLISKLIGIVSVGRYANYSFITNSLNSIINQLFSAITASVGHLGATGDDQKKIKVFNLTFFINFWIYGMISVCLVNTFNPFIAAFFRKDLIFSMGVVFTIVIRFYLTGMRQSVTTFKNALGLYWYDRYKPVFEIMINLVASIILAKYLGIAGIFIGTIVSTLTTVFWIEPFVLYKNGFHASCLPYFNKYIMYTAVTVAAVLLSRFLCSLLPLGNIAAFFAYGVISVFVFNVLTIFCFFRTCEFNDLQEYVRSILSGRLSKRKKKTGNQ